MTRETKRQQWLERVRAQQASGKTMAVYCREHGVSVRAFWYWARIFRKPVTANPKKAKTLRRFARVEVIKPSPSSQPAVSVRLPGGLVIESGGMLPDPAWIKAVVRSLTEEGLQ